MAWDYFWGSPASKKLHRNPKDRDSLSHVFAALLNGSTLSPRDVKEEGLTSLAGWLIEEGITIFNSTASLFRHFAATLTGVVAQRLVRRNCPNCAQDVALTADDRATPVAPDPGVLFVTVGAVVSDWG